MELLYKKSNYVIDVEEGKVFSSSHSCSFTFDFEQLICFMGARLSQPIPIRYDAETDQVVYWASKQWKAWPHSQSEAICSLFHTYHEYKLLS